MFMKVSKQLLVALVVLGASACSDSPVPESDERVAAEQIPQECPVAADIGVPQLTDEEIAQVVITVNTGEIEQGQLALQQNPRTEVREYAERMVQQHTTANQQLQAALPLLGLTPRESLLSQQLRAESSQTLAILRASGTGEDFERAYMDAQVATHAKTLFVMDTLVQPQLQRQELRDLSRRARAEVQEHLNDAVPIQASIPPRP